MKTMQTTYCKCFDNSCYHHQCRKKVCYSFK